MILDDQKLITAYKISSIKLKAGITIDCIHVFNKINGISKNLQQHVLSPL